MRRKLMVAAAMLLLMSLILPACGAGNVPAAPLPTEPDPTPAAPAEDGMLPVNPTSDGVLTGDLLGCADFLGKTAKEVGIPQSVISDGVISRTYADGTLFGNEDYAVLYFDDAGGEPTVGRIWIHSGKSGFETCRTELVKLYGEPLDEGENPYVEVDGGAVVWADFTGDGVSVRLSAASERNYAEITINKK